MYLRSILKTLQSKVEQKWSLLIGSQWWSTSLLNKAWKTLKRAAPRHSTEEEADHVSQSIDKQPNSKTSMTAVAEMQSPFPSDTPQCECFSWNPSMSIWLREGNRCLYLRLSGDLLPDPNLTCPNHPPSKWVLYKISLNLESDLRQPWHRLGAQVFPSGALGL